jgi:tetratricopeptide (TPR) repeat protein
MDPDLPSAYTVLAHLHHSRARTRRMSNLDHLNDLVEAERYAREALAVGGPDRADALMVLGAALVDQYVDGLGGPQLIDDGLAMLRRAEMGSGMPERLRSAIRLWTAEALVNRGHRDGNLDDVEAAVAMLEEYQRRMPRDSPMLPVVTARLAAVLQVMAAATGGTHDALRASSAARSAVLEVGSVSPLWSYDVAGYWGEWTWEQHLWRETAEAHQHALAILLALVHTQVDRSYAEQILGRRTEQLAGRAAVALARTGRPDQAAVALETGRAVLLRAALDRGAADLDGLRRAGRSDLADRYEAAVERVAEAERVALEAAMHLDEPSTTTDAATQPSTGTNNT